MFFPTRQVQYSNLPPWASLGSYVTANMLAIPAASLESLAQAFARMEGFTDGSSRIARANNNPGNLRSWAGPGKDIMNGGFVVFPSLDAGWHALKKVLADYVHGPVYGFSSPPTLEQITSKYAPAADRNDPMKYARAVSGWTGIPLGVPVLPFLTGRVSTLPAQTQADPGILISATAPFHIPTPAPAPGHEAYYYGDGTEDSGTVGDIPTAIVPSPGATGIATPLLIGGAVLVLVLLLARR